MTWGEYFDQMLDECSEGCATCRDYGASRILKEMDPTAYRRGFTDYIDSVSRGEVVCPKCGDRTITDYYVDEEDEMECDVCKGVSFECDVCSEVFDNADRASEGVDTCAACAAEAEEEDV